MAAARYKTTHMISRLRLLPRLRSNPLLSPAPISSLHIRQPSSVSPRRTVSTSTLLSSTGAHYIEAFHSHLSFLDPNLIPWSATILLSSLSLRLLSFPLTYLNQLHISRYSLALRELPRIQAFVRATPGSLLQKYVTFRRLRSLALRSAGTSSWYLFRWDLLFHIPLVVTASMGVRQLAALQTEEWKQGGMLWFPDLTIADPIAALPIATTALWVWNLDSRTAVAGVAEKSPAAAPRRTGKLDKSAFMERVMASRGEWIGSLFQVISIASLSVTMDLPSGVILLWFGNGCVTMLQRRVLQSESVRGAIGLMTKQDMEGMGRPMVLEGTKMAVKKVRRELEYVQKTVLTRFPGRRVDDKLRRDVNKVLERELWNGRISMALEAEIREDDRDGRLYIAVVRKGSDT